jgi:hypothetical protein
MQTRKAPWERSVLSVKTAVEIKREAIEDAAERIDRLCELNVEEQVLNVGRTMPVQDAWARGQALSVHGWIYRLSDGLLRDMGFTIASDTELCALEDKQNPDILPPHRGIAAPAGWKYVPLRGFAHVLEVHCVSPLWLNANRDQTLGGGRIRAGGRGGGRRRPGWWGRCRSGAFRSGAGWSGRLAARRGRC